MATRAVTQANFPAEVLNATEPVLVDFYANWCGPCGMLHPVIEALAEENPTLKVCTFDTDQAGPIAVGLGIDSIPALLLFKNGNVAARSVGYRSKEELVAWLKENGALA